MTAFKEVLVAEQEAEQAIITAKEEVATATAAARAEHRTRLEAESAKLEEAEQTVLADHKIKVAGITKKIHDQVQNQVAAVKQNFTSKKTELVTTIMQNF